MNRSADVALIFDTDGTLLDGRRAVIDAVRQVSGKAFKVTERGRRPGDPAVLTANAGKAHTELGWIPHYTDLQTIVATAWEFHNRYPNGYTDC